MRSSINAAALCEPFQGKHTADVRQYVLLPSKHSEPLMVTCGVYTRRRRVLNQPYPIAGEEDRAHRSRPVHYPYYCRGDIAPKPTWPPRPQSRRKPRFHLSLGGMELGVWDAGSWVFVTANPPRTPTDNRATASWSAARGPLGRGSRRMAG